MSSRTQFLILLLIYVAVGMGLASFAAMNFRYEMIDGHDVIYWILNGSDYKQNINYRQLGQLTHFIAHFVRPMIDRGFDFKTIRWIVEVSLVFQPIVLFSTLSLVMWWRRSYLALTHLCLTYSMAILLTHSFHMSLIPEGLLLCWWGVYAFQEMPRGRLGAGLFTVVGASGLFAASLGYEVTLIINAFLPLFFIYTLIREFQSLRKLLSARHLGRLVIVLVGVGAIYYRSRFDMHMGYAGEGFRFVLKDNTSIVLMVLFCCGLYGLCVLSPFKNELSGKTAHGLFLIALVTSAALIPWQKEIVIVGYLLRSAAVTIGSTLILFYLFIQSVYSISSKSNLISLVGQYAVYLLIIFAAYDFKSTQDWQQWRERSKEMVLKYQSGCNPIKNGEWFLGYQSVLYQETFSPKFMLDPDGDFFFQSYDGSVCQTYIDHDQKLRPKYFMKDINTNFNFDAIFNP